MKKIFTLALVIATNFIIAQTPTCSLNPTFIASTKVGIWPDSATNFVQGTVGVPYVQNITVKVPIDTVTGFGTFCFNRVVLSNTIVTNYNLPPGLNFGSSTAAVANGSIAGAPSFKFPGGANNCASIFGTPTTAGTYTLSLVVQPYVSPKFGNCPSPANVSGGSALTSPTTLNYYIIKINAATSIKEDVNSKSLNITNMPNPFSGKTQIKFTVKDEAQAKLTVYNLLGNKIYANVFKTSYGENNYELDATDWANGIYLYTIQYKNYTETKRLVVVNTN